MTPEPNLPAAVPAPVPAPTADRGYAEDFVVGDRLRHARGATVGDGENNLLTKLVVNTADGHWNDHVMAGSALGDGRLVFGLITGSLVFGLASHDVAEQALAEVGCTGLRFKVPVHVGDTLYAYSEVLAIESDPDRDDAARVAFRHWGVNQHEQVVFQGDRTILVKRRSAWAGAPA